jgi:hypothetical protein
MTDAVARAIMILAGRCLGKARHEWARAMQIEFEAAVPAVKRLPFALGCLIAACREMPRHPEGQLSLGNHALALGLLVPTAAFLLLDAGRLGHSALVYGVVDPAGSRNPYLADGQLAAAPSLLLLWLMLGAAHLRLAWVLLERDWPRVFSASAMIVAGTVTLGIYTSVLFLEDARSIQHALVTAIELMAVFAAARWHGQGSAFSAPEELA